MATTQLMIQFWVEDSVFIPITTMNGLFASATMNLDVHKTTVVREIAAEEIGGVLILNTPGTVNLSFTTTVMSEVDLISPKGKGAFLMGPSCVPSPPFAEISQLTLSLTGAGFTAPTGGTLSVELVGAGGHVYVDHIS
jgi:hypothetical protein